MGGITEHEEQGLQDRMASLALRDKTEGVEEVDEYAEHRHTNTQATRRGSTSHTGKGDRRSRSADVRSTPHRHHASHSRLNPDTHTHAHHTHGKRMRGEVNIRIVDFAHTTTGRDILPMPPGEDTSTLGKGYETKYDQVTGKALARFPPKFARKADMGFLFGLKSCCEALTGIWEDAGGSRSDIWTEVHGSVQGVGGDEEEGVRDVFERAFPDGVEDVLST